MQTEIDRFNQDTQTFQKHLGDEFAHGNLILSRRDQALLVASLSLGEQELANLLFQNATGQDECNPDTQKVYRKYTHERLSQIDSSLGGPAFSTVYLGVYLDALESGLFSDPIGELGNFDLVPLKIATEVTGLSRSRISQLFSEGRLDRVEVEGMHQNLVSLSQLQNYLHAKIK